MTGVLIDCASGPTLSFNLVSARSAMDTGRGSIAGMHRAHCSSWRRLMRARIARGLYYKIRLHSEFIMPYIGYSTLLEYI